MSASRAVILGGKAAQQLLRLPSLAPAAGLSTPAAVARRGLGQAAQRYSGWQGRAFGVSAMAASDEPVTRTYPYAPLGVPLDPKQTEISWSGQSPSSFDGDLLVLGVCEDAFATADEVTSIASEELKSFDAALGGTLTDIVALHDFAGKTGSSQTLRCGGSKGPRYVTLCGLGPANKLKVVVDWGASPLQALGSGAAAAAKAHKAKRVGVAVVGTNFSDDDTAAAAGKVANGFVNGAYESTRFKSKSKDSSVESVALMLGGNEAAAASAVQHGQALALGALLTRYLVEAPPNVCTPSYLADTAAKIAAAAPEVMKLEVLEREDCEALGMGLYLGVAAASAEPPKFIHLTYTPKGEVKKRVAIVGKGLTFDSGGYNIKAGAGSMIEMMKFDMGGSGAALGAAKVLSLLQPEGVEVHFVVASCENMVAGSGLRPGDILVASNGKTVEVNNTDAEGRLTLADALLFAQKQCGAEAIVDIATLTGACMIALGDGMGGMWSPSDELAASLSAASKRAGEKLWRMPLEDSYFEQLKSGCADMKNTGGRLGGSITAALFLKEYVDTDKVQWSHLDIAGPVWRDKDGGATGFGAQLLAEWAMQQGQQ
ncbi:hypothetical protein D9Q98_003250 [Chlorella vulgaris]|uniref:Cytosol aminopeptidase domain-containing protein n=1 Tax=Chlorella vulgaris TaxID=3077 RepID=A0A9D4TTL5_CHLVU|nr:hypothetical protein D9Q98_003250 [Chlorella vulgaris]